MFLGLNSPQNGLNNQPLDRGLRPFLRKHAGQQTWQPLAEAVCMIQLLCPFFEQSPRTIVESVSSFQNQFHQPDKCTDVWTATQGTCLDIPIQVIGFAYEKFRNNEECMANLKNTFMRAILTEILVFILITYIAYLCTYSFSSLALSLMGQIEQTSERRHRRRLIAASTYFFLIWNDYSNNTDSLTIFWTLQMLNKRCFGLPSG